MQQATRRSKQVIRSQSELEVRNIWKQVYSKLFKHQFNTRLYWQIEKNQYVKSAMKVKQSALKIAAVEELS